MKLTTMELLGRVPGVYDDLVDAALPGRTGEPSDRSPDPRERPPPGRLDVMDHRHLLVRGLRWWVDAVRDGSLPARLGDDVRGMCRWLAENLHVMADEDRADLGAQLDEWLRGAWPFMGDPADDGPDLSAIPPEAADQVLRVHDAAKLLGCTVRTIQRRAPRLAGMVRLGDVMPRCARHDMVAAWCAECASTARVSR